MSYIPTKSGVRQFIGVWLVALSGLAVLCLYMNVIDAPRPLLEKFTSLNWLFLTVVLAYSLPRGIWSISWIFFSAISIFHCGLIFASSIGGITDADIIYQISKWFYNQRTDNAIHLANLAMVGLAFSSVFFSQPAKEADNSISPEELHYLYHIGGGLLTTMILLFFLIALASGALNSYEAYLEASSNSPLLAMLFSYINVFIGIAIVFLCVCYRKGESKIYLWLFLFWAAIAFKLGLRGEVMFPITVAGCMLGRRGVPMKTPVLAVAVLAFLVISGIVKNARVSGDYSTISSLSPMNAVAELGSSLRPVEEAIKWRVNGYELLHGTSYWAPVERQLALILPWIERPNAFQDPRLLNIVVQERAGPIGFSPVAEAYLNYGELGVLLIFILMGAGLAYLDGRRSVTHADILMGVALVPLFIMVRNSFTHVPVQIVLGSIIAIIFMVVARRRPLP